MTAPTNASEAVDPVVSPPVVPKFEINGALPDRVTMLEASAGTGKTYALAGLALRYIAEGHVLVSQLCVVTFTEATTAELRGRLRLRGAAGRPGTELLLLLDGGGAADCGQSRGVRAADAAGRAAATSLISARL